MERPDRLREPLQKRKKSEEERQKGTSSKTENREERTSCHYKERHRDLGDKNPPGKHFSRENSSEKDEERTKKSGEDKNQGRTLHKHTQTSGAKSEGHDGRDTAEESQSSNPCQVRAEGIASTQAQPAVSTKPLQRHWEPLSSSSSDDLWPPGVSAGFDFTVMSYNILSQDLLLDNSYLYRHCQPSVLPWEFRLPNLLQEIQQYNADILCLQEVQEDHFVNQIKPALEALGYQSEYKKRTGSKPDGCAVVFKSSRLSLVSSNPVEFFRPADSLLDRDNVGLVVVLRPTSDPSASLCVANTHLLYNPRRGDIKLAQLAILLAEVHRVSRLPDGSFNPVLLCGDFNSTPWSPLYSFLMRGCLDYRGIPVAMVSGQENPPRGQRLLPTPLWSNRLGISRSCRYKEKPAESSSSSPTAVEEAVSDLTVEELASKAAADLLNRWRIEHGLRLQSSYSHRLMPDGRLEITTCHSRTAMTVDYILYTPECPVAAVPPASLPGGRGLQLLGRLSLVGRSELEQVNGLPNENHSSDHLPLLARFRLLL